MDDIGNSGNILRDTIIGTNATNQLTSNQADFFSSFTTLDHNQYYFPGANLATVNGTTYTTLGDWQAAGGGANSQAGDPLLVDPANDDWHLQAGSPAIGASSTGDDIGPFARVPTIASCEATDANTIDVTWSVPDWGGIYWTTAANYDAEENAVDLTETDAVVVNDILTRLTVSDTMTSGTTIVVKPLRGAVNTLDGIGVSTNLLRAINRADTTGVQCTNTIGSAPTAEITGLSAVSVSDTLDPDHTIDHLVDGCVATGPNCGVGNANLSAFSAVIDLGGASQDLTRLDLYGDDGGDWICSTWDAASCGTDSACAAPTSLFTGADCTGQQWFSQSFASVNTRYVQMTVTGQAEGTEVRELKAFEGATSVGILATPHVRFRKWGVAGETFTAVSTMRDGVEDGAVALAPGAKGHLRAKVACQDNPCDVTDFGFYACDGSCGTPSNWYAVGTTFGGKLLRRTSDPTVTSEGATTEQLTACTTFVSGAYLDDQAGAFPTFELTNGECTELVLVFELSALANVGDVVRINVQQGDGTDLQSTMDAQIDVTTSWVQW